MTSYLIDDTDYRILQYLIEDSTLSHKEIGEKVHMTGQAVGARIRRMRELEIIEGYTLQRTMTVWLSCTGSAGKAATGCASAWRIRRH
ncbi:HTH-type transcriptional regulator LrpC [compost metagenome]